MTDQKLRSHDETALPSWHVSRLNATAPVGGEYLPRCPICKGEYRRTYEEHTGVEKHRAAVRKAVGR